MTKYERFAEQVWTGQADAIEALEMMPVAEVIEIQKALEERRGLKLDLKARPKRIQLMLAKPRAR